MTATLDESQVHAWLSTLYGDTAGLINIVSTGNWRGACFTDVDAAVRYVSLLDRRKPLGIYARVTTLSKLPPAGSRGLLSDSREFIGFVADMDIAGPGHKWHVCPKDSVCPDADDPRHRPNFTPLIPDLETCLKAIEDSGLPEPTEWVSTGGGYYPWWLLRKPTEIDNVDDLAKVSERWQDVIAASVTRLGYHHDVSGKDLARVLRIPGTVNRKVPDDWRMCEWRQDLSDCRAYELDELLTYLDEAESALPQPESVSADTIASVRAVTSFVGGPGIDIPAPRTSNEFTGGIAPGDAFNRATTWEQLLTADGATIGRDRGNYVEVTRPGKDLRDGISGTIGYGGSDVLKVHSSSWHPLVQDKTYSRFGYYAATRHNGDHQAAARHLLREGYGQQGTRVQPSSFYEDDEPAAEVVAAFDGGDKGVTKAPEAAVAAPKAPTVAATYTYTESGMADRMAARHAGDWRCIHDTKQNTWLSFEGGVWKIDKRKRVPLLAEDTVKAEWHASNERWINAPDKTESEKAEKATTAAGRLLTAAHINGIANLFGQRHGVTSSPDEYDRDEHRYKVTCDNGVIDLKTMNFGPHDKTLMQTKKLAVAYDSDAKAPGWEKFLTEVLPDPAVREYLQRAAGYTLTGDTDRKAIFMLHGDTNCGKSQILNVFKMIFGSMAETADPSAFIKKEAGTGPTPSLHKLRGARLAVASETNEGVRLDEALIKRLTGGEDVTSRDLYQPEVTWRPRFAMWLATNHLPKLSSDDNAIWKRVKPIHCPVVFGLDGGPAEVFDISRKLYDAEASGILNWLLEGIRKYREHGLGEPDTIVAGVAAYRRETDDVARFLDQMIQDEAVIASDSADDFIESKLLYAWYTAWCADEGIRYPLAATRFGRRMVALKYVNDKDPSRTKRIWRKLKAGKNTFLGTGQPLRM